MTTDANQADVLVTGATGMIGRWLLAALTQRGHRVAALVRRAAERGPELSAFVARLGGDPTKLVFLEGDVESEDLGLEAPLDAVKVVYHLAARFAFGLSRDEARATNVLGTRHVMRWAAKRPKLERFVFLGGYRMTKADLDAPDAHYAAGAYEGSKIEAYALFRSLAAELQIPWTAVHPSGVIGDSRTGETTQLVGIGETVKRLYERRLPALAGNERTFVPLVTVDHLADYLATVPERAESEGKDLVVFDPASPTLPELVRLIASIMGVPAPQWTLPVGLVASLPSSLTGLHRESTRFLVEDRYDTREGDAHAAAVGLTHPPLDRSLARFCAYLVSTRFLAEPDRAIGAFVEGTFVVGDPAASEVVMLHGIPFDGEAMAPLARALGRSTARVDVPRIGRSGDGEATIDARLTTLLAARSRPALLVGHSLGAALAVRYAATHAERVSGLVLVAPAFLTAPAPFALRLSPVVAFMLGRLDPASFDARFLAEGDSTLTAPARDSALESLRRAGGPGHQARALADAVGSRAETIEAFARVRGAGVPALVVHGSQEAITEDLHGAERVVIDGAGHNPHLTHVEAVTEAIRAFAHGLGRSSADENDDLLSSAAQAHRTSAPSRFRPAPCP